MSAFKKIVAVLVLLSFIVVFTSCNNEKSQIQMGTKQ